MASNLFLTIRVQTRSVFSRLGIQIHIVIEKTSFQLSNVDADGEVVLSLLSTKSIVDGIPLVELKMPHKSGDADIHCYDVRLPSNITDTFAVVRVQVKIIFLLECWPSIYAIVPLNIKEHKVLNWPNIARLFYYFTSKG